MGDLKIIQFGKLNFELREASINVRSLYPTAIIETEEDIKTLSKMIIERQSGKLLLMMTVDKIGENRLANDFLRELSNYELPMKDWHVGIIISSESDLYTKSYGSKFIYLINKFGAEIIGHSLVEGIAELKNFNTWQKVLSLPLEQIYARRIEILAQRLVDYERLSFQKPKILVLHAGHKKLSNTMMLWDKIESYLEGVSVEKIHVEEGKITDCYGCKFETCTYFSMDKSCFYGGFVVDELFPKIEDADIVIWICPNYNDSISAKLMAVINRLTALYRRIDFYDKYIGAVVVSGSSGSDSVARQLISALNMNKGFRLMESFSIEAISNDPGDIMKVLNLDQMAINYVEKINKLKIQKNNLTFE